jgi:predicted O-methyltransferase YrrM
MSGRLEPPLRQSEFSQPATSLVVVSRDQPLRLSRALPGLLTLQAPLLVVNAGSESRFDAEYASICSAPGVRLLQIPRPCSVAEALQAGLRYWLADPKVEWISCFRDEVEVGAGLLQRLASVQDAVRRPLLSGRLDAGHPGEKQIIQGESVHLCREMTGPHFHAHRNFWMRHLGRLVQGQPNEKIRKHAFLLFLSADQWHFKAARRRWWKTSQTVTVAVLPGLVRVSKVLSGEESWGNPPPPDPELGRSALADGRDPGPFHYGDALARCFGQSQEGAIHPHAPEECAELYHSIDNGSTEIEVLNFLHALVHLFKPGLVLETGTFLGFGTCALSSGLKANGFGRLITIELDEKKQAWGREHVRQLDPDLLSKIDFVRDSSLTYLEDYPGLPFNFAFLDSALETRMVELQILRRRKLLSPGAICLIHDTSPWRPEETYGGGASNLLHREQLAGLGPSFEVLQFPYSRGFHLLRYRGPET